jgi:hypothetical protein
MYVSSPCCFCFAAVKGRCRRSKGRGTRRDGGRRVLSLLTRHCGERGGGRVLTRTLALAHH